MAVPASRNLVLYAGDTWKMSLRLRAKDLDQVPGDYLDLTGSTPSAQIRDSSGSLLATIACDLADQTASPGLINLSLTPTQTAALTNGFWDFQVSLSGEIKTYLRGSVTVTPQVTV